MENIRWVSVQPLNGGMSIGVEQALETPPVTIIDNGAPHNLHYINYMNNVRKLDIPVIKMNWELSEFITPEDEDKFNKYINDIDIAIAVPVCAGLSMLNPQKEGKFARGDADNVQNKNQYDNINFILGKIKPKVFVYENAPTLFTNLGLSVWDRIIDISSKYNYSITGEKVDTFNYGIPQHRKRTFVYFWKNKEAFYLDNHKENKITLLEYLNKIPKDATLQYDFFDPPENVWSYYFLKSKYTYEEIKDIMCKNNYKSTEFFLVKEKLLKEAQEFFTKELNKFLKNKNYIEDFENGYKKKFELNNDNLKLLYKIKKDKKLKVLIDGFRLSYHIDFKIGNNSGWWDSSIIYSKCGKSINGLINKTIRSILHPKEERLLNLRELHWLMGLPHNYELVEPEKSYSMLTQSVPVNTSKHVGLNLKKYIENKLKKSNSSVVKIDNEKEKIVFEDNKYKNLPTNDWLGD